MEEQKHDIVGRRQCDQIGQFLKVLGDKFLTKLSQIFGDFFWDIWKHVTFNLKTAVSTFWESFIYFLFQHLVTWS